jgi:hypothetical protein
MIVPGIVITAGWWMGGSDTGAGTLSLTTGRAPSPGTPQVSVEKVSVGGVVNFREPGERQAARRWWQRPSPAERKANRARMAQEGASAAITAGSLAWLVLGPSKWSKAFNLVLRFGTGSANSVEDMETGQSRYYDPDPQGA